MTKSALQIARAAYQPKLPKALKGAVKVKEGDAVKRGQTLMILEAMKMETPITAPVDGIVSEIHVKAGQRIESGDLLMVIE